VLVVSTDPAHSLGDALAVSLRAAPRRVPAVPGLLFAAEIDAEAAFVAFMRKRRGPLAAIVEHGTYLDREDIARFVRLSLPGVDELMALLEVRRLAAEGRFDEVVVDTAPTGHTLRLLAMPETLGRVAEVLDTMQAKHRFLSRSLGGGSYRPDAADALVYELQEEARALHDLLRDRARTRFSWVTLPEILSVEETRDGLSALDRAGIHAAEVVVNRMTPPPRGPCALCSGRRQAEAEALRLLRRLRPLLVFRTVPALPREPRGPRSLRVVAGALAAPAALPRTPPRRKAVIAKAGSAPPGSWLEAFVSEKTRLLLFAGKGGVGKTTCAAAVALLARARWPDRRFLLLSADPAHSLADVLRVPLGPTPRPVAASLDACEIDAAAAFAEWRKRYRDAAKGFGGGGDVSLRFDRQVIEDLVELAPPGLDEILAVIKVADALLEGSTEQRYDALILDSAPTGHALRLIAMPELALEWIRAMLAVLLKYREVVGLGELGEELVARSRSLRQLRDLLHDKTRAAAIVVARAAALPRLETGRLIRSLGKHHVSVSAVVVNAMTPPGCVRCRQSAAAEGREVRGLRSALGARVRMFRAPAVAPPPRGAGALSRWSRTWSKID
jgi:arsenite-transporting ATPase